MPFIRHGEGTGTGTPDSTDRILAGGTSPAAPSPAAPPQQLPHQPSPQAKPWQAHADTQLLQDLPAQPAVAQHAPSWEMASAMAATVHKQMLRVHACVEPRC